MMNLYSYVVAVDTGFAPNPFYGYCTVATCMYKIREDAKKGDWIIGLGSKENNLEGKLVYVMQVTEILSFDEYFKNGSFSNKKPTRESWQQERGDNIYELKSDGSYRQLPSFHSNKDGSTNEEKKADDLKSKNVLISNNYGYFGAHGPLIRALENADGKSLIHKGRGYTKFSLPEDKHMIEEFLPWIKDVALKGYVGHPYNHNLDWGCSDC